MLLNFGEHGREIITSEIALRLLEMLLVRFSALLSLHVTREVRVGAAQGDALIVEGHRAYLHFLLRFALSPVCSETQLTCECCRHVEFVIVPVLSVWSRQQIEQGKICTRTNQNGLHSYCLLSNDFDLASGVDLNRNWDFQWRKGKGDGSEQDPGPAPFSEEVCLALIALHSVILA